MRIRFTADQAREAVAEIHAPYTSEEVYEKIERLARSGRVHATFSGDRWSDELTKMLAEDGYGLQVVTHPIGKVAYVTWGPSSRKLREGSAVE